MQTHITREKSHDCDALNFQNDTCDCNFHTTPNEHKSFITLAASAAFACHVLHRTNLIDGPVIRAMKQHPIRSLCINGRLAWPVAELKRVLGVSAK